MSESVKSELRDIKARLEALKPEMQIEERRIGCEAEPELASDYVDHAALLVGDIIDVIEEREAA